VAGSCGHSKEPSGSIKGGERLGLLSYCGVSYLLMQNCALLVNSKLCFGWFVVLIIQQCWPVITGLIEINKPFSAH
jgi:hypothetical protein